MKKLLFGTMLVITLLGCTQKSESCPILFSHRGDSKYFIEHTFASYDSAIKKGSKYIEQDLVLSKDGTLYISHDMDAKRITGVDQDYAQMSDKQINRLRTKNHEPIHTLASVFERYKNTVNYVPEIRPEKGQVDAFIKLVKEYGLEDHIIVQVRNLEQAEEIKKVFSRMQVLYLAFDSHEYQEALRSPFINIICLNKQCMSCHLISEIHKKNKKVAYWTLDSPKEIEKAMCEGVDIIYTDDTALAIKTEKGGIK